jgi:hypothetical protein
LPFYQDFKLPYGITFQPPPPAFEDPFEFYEKLSRIGAEIEPNLWKYYFTLDKVLKNGERCTVGGVSCAYKMLGKITSTYFYPN